MANTWFCSLTITRNNGWLVKMAGKRRANWKIMKMFWKSLTWGYKFNILKIISKRHCVLVYLYQSPISLSYLSKTCLFKGKENDALKVSNTYKCPAWIPRNSHKYLRIKRHENDMALSYKSLSKNNPDNLYVKNSRKLHKNVHFSFL